MAAPEGMDPGSSIAACNVNRPTDELRLNEEGVTEQRATPRPVGAPVDVSADFLRASAERLSTEYRDLAVVPVVADLTDAFPLPENLPRPLVAAYNTFVAISTPSH